MNLILDYLSICDQQEPWTPWLETCQLLLCSYSPVIRTGLYPNRRLIPLVVELSKMLLLDESNIYRYWRWSINHFAAFENLLYFALCFISIFDHLEFWKKTSHFVFLGVSTNSQASSHFHDSRIWNFILSCRYLLKINCCILLMFN